MPIDPNASFTGYQGTSSGLMDGDQTGEVLDAEKLAASLNPFDEIGNTGLKRAAGFLDEEFLPQLRGRKAVQIYKEMSENDSLIGAMLFAIEMLIRNVEWHVEPGGKSRTDAIVAELVETSMDDLSQTWDEFVSEALSMLVYGWSMHEIVYKRRGGMNQRNPKLRSKHTDGLISWRKMPIRAQETMFKWVFDESGDTKAMVQMPPPRYQQIVLPIDRCLLFRFRPQKNSPEGRSILRNAYRSYHFKKRIEEFESVGVERDLAGMPMVSVPAEWLSAKPGSHQHKAVLEFKKMVKSIRRDEQEGLVFPIAYDQDTKMPLFKFELLSSGGSRQFPTDSIIQRYEQRILMTVLADFILVGHQGVGSYSLHTDKTGIFRNALNSVSDSIAQVINRHAIPRLIRLNGFDVEQYPKIKPMDVDSPDITQLGSFMSQMSGLGMEWFPNADLEQFVRKSARLPLLNKDDKERIEIRQHRAEKTAFLTTQAQYVQAKMSLSQQAQQMVDTANPDTADDHAMMGATNAQPSGSSATTAAQGDQQEASSGTSGGSGGNGRNSRAGV
jgi:hypothetical protein